MPTEWGPSTKPVSMDKHDGMNATAATLQFGKGEGGHGIARLLDNLPMLNLHQYVPMFEHWWHQQLFS